MQVCRCERCCPGDPLPTYTEAYRLACEVRSVLRRSLEQRREYLQAVEKARGLSGRRVLEAAILAEWGRSKSPRP